MAWRLGWVALGLAIPAVMLPHVGPRWQFIHLNWPERPVALVLLAPTGVAALLRWWRWGWPWRDGGDGWRCC